MSLYKACDIRGPVEELSPELYRTWGRALGNRVGPGATFLAGGDVRLTTPGFLAALISGLAEAGARVVDLGVLPTPMAYFAGRHLGAPGVAVVTASHSPPGINGLKWTVDELPPTEAEILALQRSVEEGLAGPRRPGGSRTTFDPAPSYRDWLCRRWQGTAVTGKAIVDPGSGCWSGRAAPLLAAAFPGLKVEAIHDLPDGLFRARNPDSARPEHLTALIAAVVEQGADLGIAFDGDGDRVSLVDEEGVVLSPEETAWILVQGLAGEWPGRVFVYDLKCSSRIPEEVRRLGGTAEPQRSGHAFIRTRMIERQALFGAEISGHYFYGELRGGDDGLFTACRVLAGWAAGGRSLAAMRRACPAIHATPDLRLVVPAEEQEAVLARVRSAFAEWPQSTLDGVRLEFPDGWALARRSVTAAELTFRFEGDSRSSLDRIVREFASRIGGLGERLEAAYQTQKAGTP
ncbi:MAG: hypothetical protein WDA75_25045 [Candidatus Latescibacterota bacterium]|jgi:phosphomannomutase/phosphoglucomutase